MRGAAGRVLAFEVDEALAGEATRRLASRPWIEMRHGDASGPLGETFDAILVNAGVTHPLDSWLDALAPGGRLMLPLTATMPATASTLGKGLVFLLTKDEAGAFAARVIAVVAVYSALGHPRSRAERRHRQGPDGWTGALDRRQAAAPRSARAGCLMLAARPRLLPVHSSVSRNGAIRWPVHRAAPRSRRAFRTRRLVVGGDQSDSGCFSGGVELLDRASRRLLASRASRRHAASTASIRFFPTQPLEHAGRTGQPVGREARGCAVERMGRGVERFGIALPPRRFRWRRAAPDSLPEKLE